jgi:hypothetical protein
MCRILTSFNFRVENIEAIKKLYFKLPGLSEEWNGLGMWHVCGRHTHTQGFVE